MPSISDLAPGSPQGGVGPAIHDLPLLHAAAAGHLYEEECDDSASCLELDDTPEIVRRIILQDSSQIYIPAGPWGWLPIMYAADRGDASSVQAFLDHGETTERLVHAVDGMEDTCLHIAASRGHEAVVSVLLDHNAYIHAQDCWGATPLALAASNGHLAVVVQLLGAKKKPDISTRGVAENKFCGKRWLNSQDEKIDRRVRARMLEGRRGPIDQMQARMKVEGGERSEQGHRERLYDRVNNYGRSPLWRACCQGHDEVVRALLRAGCDPFLEDDQGVTPRAVAGEKGHNTTVALIDECVKVLQPSHARVFPRLVGWHLSRCFSLGKKI